ncbi:MAG TPA: MFS transporter [Trebonia sp.]|nr:MFS transporter [Trebonia sp.]
MALRLIRASGVSYAAFMLVGVSAGAGGVLLPSQMASYGVDRSTIGITFFAISAGYMLAGLSNGAMLGRAGTRIALAAGAGAFILSGLYLATRPPFTAFVAAQVIVGYGLGVVESALNVHLAGLPRATALLNRLHAFFGVGALAGPLITAWILRFASWTTVWLVLALACVPILAGFLASFPGRQSAAQGPGHADPAGGTVRAGAGGLLAAALRDRGVQLGTAMLAIYVGLEISVGSWGFSYLVQTRALPATLAGYTVSGYWLGLTLGRFLISPIATRAGVTPVGMIYACLAGTAAAIGMAWLLPTAPACVALGLLGFFLGPVFPTTMAIAPRLTRERLVPAAIGVMNAVSLVGGAALPWLAGTLAQDSGMWVLLPFALALALAQFAAWRPIAARLG